MKESAGGMSLRHVRSRSWICSGDRAVLASSVVSCCSLVLVMSQASVTGTLVNRDLTSKLTRRSVGPMLMLLIFSMKCLELTTW